jgi:hypothetical protein
MCAFFQPSFVLFVAGRYQELGRSGLGTADCLGLRSAYPEMGWDPPARLSKFCIGFRYSDGGVLDGYRFSELMVSCIHI